jgi:hypothetical protein
VFLNDLVSGLVTGSHASPDIAGLNQPGYQRTRGYLDEMLSGLLSKILGVLLLIGYIQYILLVQEWGTAGRLARFVGSLPAGVAVYALLPLLVVVIVAIILNSVWQVLLSILSVVLSAILARLGR